MDNSEPVKVFIRIRPEIPQDTASPLKLTSSGSWANAAALRPNSNVPCVNAISDVTVRLSPPDGNYGARKTVSAVDDKHFTFDRIFRESSSQEDMYEVVKNHVLACINGYNSTIFAYGATGSGKSYTMTGTKFAPGVIPRAIGDIFSLIEERVSTESDVYFLVRLSYVELYNSNFRNLLEQVAKESTTNATKPRAIGQNAANITAFFTTQDDPECSFTAGFGTNFAAARSNAPFLIKQPAGIIAKHEKIEVHENPISGVYLSGQNLHFTVTTAQEAFQLIAKGNKVRTTGATNCNETSSRSHAILTFFVESRTMTTTADGDGGEATMKGELRLGKIHLVDLAGSERLNMSGAEGETLEETKSINASLSALGDVLSALAKNATAVTNNARHAENPLKRGPSLMIRVPYRNSKLTHMLKDSLGGNSKTIMITNVRVGSDYFSQTQVSLEWSARARTIRNRTVVNRNVVGDTGIQQVTAEIEKLTARIDERTLEFERLKAQQALENKENIGLKARIRELERINFEERKVLESQVSQVIHSQQGHIQSQRTKISLLQTALQDELTMSQNVIAEQEKEIQWLHDQLATTALAAQDQDKLKRIQQVSDAWQLQAKTTHQELSTVLQQAEELRGINTELQSRLQAMEESNRRVAEEASARTQETVELTNQLTSSLLERQEADKALAETKSELKGHLRAALEREKELLHKISTLEGEQRTAKGAHEEDLRHLKSHSLQLQTRLDGMEKDKAEMTSRLNSTIVLIEKQTAQVVEEAAAKIARKESQLKDAEIQSQLRHGEVQKLQSDLKELRDMTDLKIANRDKTIHDLETALNKELQFSSQQEAKILSMEGLVEGFRDKIGKLKARVQECEAQMAAAASKHASDQAEWAKEVAAVKSSKEREREALMNEFEKILQAKKGEFQAELESAVNDWTELRDQTEAAHSQEVAALHAEFEQREAQFQEQLAATEMKVSAMIEDEIDGRIRQLESLHTTELRSEATKHEEELERARKKTRAECDKEATEKVRQAVAAAEEAQQAALAALQQELDARLEQTAKQLESLHATELRSEAAKHDEELERARKKTRAECDKEAAEKVRQAVAAVEEAQQVALAALQQELDARLEQTAKQLERRHSDAMSDLKDEHAVVLAEALRRAKKEASAELAAKLDQLAESDEQERQRCLAEQRAKYESEIARVKALLKDDAASSLESLRAEVEAEKAQQRRSVQEEHAAALEELERRLHLERMSTVEEVLAKAEADKKTALSALRQQAADDLQDAEDLHRREMERLQKVHAQRLESEQKRNGSELSAREAELIADHEAAVRAAEEQFKADLSSAVQKERSRLGELHEAEMDEMQAESQARVRKALSTAEERHSEALQAAVEAECALLNEQHQQKLTAAEEGFRALLKEALLAQKTDLDVRSSEQTEQLRARLSAEHSRLEAALRAEHDNELEQLQDDHREELAELRAEMENALSSTQNEKDQTIVQLKADLVAAGVKAREELSAALTAQQKEFSEKQRAELERVRAAIQEAEARHQDELSGALAAHLAELSKQRRQLEATHGALVDSLHEELAVAKERCSQALALAAAKEGEGSQAAIEMKIKFDEQLRAAVKERDVVHRAETAALESAHEGELVTLRGTVEKLRQRLSTELQTRDSEHHDDLARQLAALREKHTAALAETKRQHEEALETQVAEQTARHRAEMDRLREECRALQTKTVSTSTEAEARIADLSATIQQQAAQFEADRARLLDDNKTKLARSQERHHAEIAALEATQHETEARLKAKHKEQMARLKEETDSELARQREEDRATLVKRDEFYQGEIAALKAALARRESELHAEVKGIEEAHERLGRKNAGLLDKLKEQQEAFSAEREELRAAQEEALRDAAARKENAIARLTSELLIKHQSEVDELESAIEAVRKDLRAQQQLLASEAAQHKTERDEIVANENLRVTQLRQTHTQELAVLRTQFDSERRELVAAKEEAVRHTMQYSDAETNRIMTDMKDRHAQELRDAEATAQLQVSQLEQQLATLTADHQARLKEMEEAHRDDVDGLEHEVEKERTASRRLKETHAAQMQELERQIVIERRALAQSHEDTVERLRETHREELLDLQQRCDAEVLTLEQRLHKTGEHAQSQILDAQTTLSHEKAALAKLREEHRADVATREASFQEKLIALDRERAAAEQTSLSELARLREEHRAELTAKEAAFQEQLAALDRRRTESEQEKLSTQAESLRELHDEAMQVVRQELHQARAETEHHRADYERRVSVHADEMTQLREKHKQEIEVERASLADNFNKTLSLHSTASQRELLANKDDLQAVHSRELELVRSQCRAEMLALEESKDREVQALARRAEEHDDEVKELRRQMAKESALRESLGVELENLKAEKHTMLDSMSALEVQVIEHGKAKFEARVLAERDKIDKSYKDAFAETQAHVAAKVEELAALKAKLTDTETEIASLKAVAKFAEEERLRQEAMFRSVLSERESAHEADLKRSLEAQHDELQNGYLKLIQQQVDSLMVLIQKQSTQHSSSMQVDDLQNRFMTLVQDLPDLWKQKHGIFLGPNAQSQSPVPPQTPERQSKPGSPVKTPLFLLATNSSRQSLRAQSRDSFDAGDHGSDLDSRSRARANGRQTLPWSSPSLRSSPTDQLIAAILDGDVQGIRAVVRSKGEDLNAEFWRDLNRSVLPLHRAMSGLHFHGSEKLLVATIETLAQLGADVNAADHAGNTVLHRAIQLCTSKSVSRVVETLLMRGSHHSARNKEGDTPLHSECKRVRAASAHVIEALIAAGADPNSKNQHNASITPLTLVLLRGASSTVTGAGLIGQGTSFGLSAALADRGLELSIDTQAEGLHEEADYDTHPHGRGGHSLINDSEYSNEGDLEKARTAARRVWIRAAEMLVKSGAHWDPAWRTPHKCSQLHLFLAAFPPSREDGSMYRALLKSALEHGLSPTVDDDRGRNALFVLCEQMSVVPSDQSPDSTRLMGIVLDACGSSGVGGSDRTGRTVFDIEERVAHSCLSACRQMLLDAGGTHRTGSRASATGRSAANHAPPSGASVASHRSSRGSGRNNNDWEFEKPRPGSAPGSNGASSTASTYRFSAASAEEGKRRVSSSSSVSYASHKDTHYRSSASAASVTGDDQYRRRPGGSSSVNGGSSSSYFDDVEDEGEVDGGRLTGGRAPQKLPPFSSYTPILHKNGGTLR